jgi:hypothetical protein
MTPRVIKMGQMSIIPAALRDEAGRVIAVQQQAVFFTIEYRPVPDGTHVGVIVQHLAEQEVPGRRYVLYVDNKLLGVEQFFPDIWYLCHDQNWVKRDQELQHKTLETIQRYCQELTCTESSEGT